MTQLIALDNIDSDEVDSLIALATNNATLNGTATLGVATETVSLALATAKIQASDVQASDQFGQKVSISGDGNTAIVGSTRSDDYTGSVWVFTRSGTSWSQQAELISSDIAAEDSFGSVSISDDGNTAIVGAWREDTGGSNAGAAYIFVRSGTSWSQQAKIVSSDIEAADFFGSDISISGDGNTAVVGAWAEDPDGIVNAGSAYIFTRSGTTWSQQAKIKASDKQESDYFSTSSISSDGNTVIVCANGEDTGGGDAGAAYIFTRSGTSWSQQAKIQASDPEAVDNFGISVSISSDGNTAIVGAWQEDTGGSNAGAAYIFTRSGTSWSQQAKIQASDKEADDQFGQSVSISSDGNTAIVGARNEDTGASNAGAAYFFTRSGSTWTEIQKIQASDLEAGDQFGISVSISSDGNTAIVGASTEDTGASDAGAAYVFSLHPTFDISQSSIFVHNTATENFTANFTNVPTVDNRTISTALIIPQGATGYLPTAVQINGESQVILWQGAVVPVPSINASDVVRFTLLRSGGTWSVLGAINKFGSV